tara:strand:+ start:12267 stop:12494 length:228 start_codon:yes stop_codon:yes gene_type:complete
MDKEIAILEARIADLEMQVAGKDMVIDEICNASRILIQHLANLELYYPGSHNIDKYHPIWKSIDDLHFWVRKEEM